MCSIDVDDPADLWFDVTQRARKEHQCSVCRTTIRPGESYLRNKYLADGEWSSAGIACAVCACIYTSFREAHGGGYGPDQLVVDLRDCVYDTLHATETHWSRDGSRIEPIRHGRDEWFVEAKKRGKQWRDALAVIYYRRRHESKRQT
jgi:hypothetical protein